MYGIYGHDLNCCGTYPKIIALWFPTDIRVAL